MTGSESQFHALNQRLDRLESLLELLVHSQGRRPDPDFISWTEAARRLGLVGTNPGRAAKARVERERQRPDGLRIRVMRGGVNRADFLQFLQRLQSKESPGRVTAGAVDRLLGGGR